MVHPENTLPEGHIASAVHTVVQLLIHIFILFLMSQIQKKPQRAIQIESKHTKLIIRHTSQWQTWLPTSNCLIGSIPISMLDQICSNIDHLSVPLPKQDIWTHHNSCIAQWGANSRIYPRKNYFGTCDLLHTESCGHGTWKSCRGLSWGLSFVSWALLFTRDVMKLELDRLSKKIMLYCFEQLYCSIDSAKQHPELSVIAKSPCSRYRLMYVGSTLLLVSMCSRGVFSHRQPGAYILENLTA